MSALDKARADVFAKALQLWRKWNEADPDGDYTDADIERVEELAKAVAHFDALVGKKKTTPP